MLLVIEGNHEVLRGYLTLVLIPKQLKSSLRHTSRTLWAAGGTVFNDKELVVAAAEHPAKLLGCQRSRCRVRRRLVRTKVNEV